MRYRAVIEYDGTNLFGWQRQVNLPTVQQHLEESLLPISKVLTTVHGAGRTDSGVHALGQVAHFDLETNHTPFAIQQCMNHHLRDVAISVLSIEPVSQDFHARFMAKKREYLYKILNRRSKPGLLLNRAWWVARPLDVDAMNEAAQFLIGEHDFSAFRAQGCQAKSPVKIVDKAYFYKEDDVINFVIMANGFLYHQVRNIVGSLYNVGIAKWSKEDFLDIMSKNDRALAGMTTPACGLYFKKAYY